MSSRKLDLPKQLAHLASFQSLRGQLLPPKLLDLLGGLAATWPCSASQAKNRRTVTSTRLTVDTAWLFFPAQVVLEVGDVPGRHSADREALLVRRREPPGELSSILDERSPAVCREVVSIEEGGK